MKILLIEDLQKELKACEAAFREEGYSCEYVNNCTEALEKIALYEYDGILLHYRKDNTEMLSFLNQLERSNSAVGLIILSSESSIEEKVKILNMGVDDYITIPFHFAELDARIKAVIRRKKFNTRKNLYFANLIIEFDTRTVFVWNNPVNFTRKEYEIFLHLVANKDKILSKISLAEYLWGDNTDQMDSFNILSAHIKNIRRKMKEAKAEVEIKNSYGVGYQIIEL